MTRGGLYAGLRAVEDRVQQAGEASLEVVTAERIGPLGPGDLLMDQAGFTKHLEVVGAG